jgi:hypothetical protein
MPSLFASVFLAVVLFAPAVICAPAQENRNATARPEIRGIVLEPGSNLPVVEAEVTLEVHGATRPRIMPSTPKSTVTAKTDATGSFVFRPDDFGYLSIQTKKDGYSVLRPMPGGPSSSQEITLSTMQPSRDVRLFLSRPCLITGVVVDEETGQPVANLRLGAVRATKGGGFTPFMDGEATTDAQGRFVVANLGPGEFAIEVVPQKFAKERVLSTFSENDVRVVDQDFEHTYWPGGRGEDAVSPVLLVSGANVDAGVLRVKKTAYYRVHARFPGWNCEAEESTSVIQQDGSGGALLANAACGQDVLITGFSPGAHRLMFGVRKPKGGSSAGASPDFVIGDENVEVIATLERPIVLEGAIVGAEGMKLPDLSRITVLLFPVSRHVLMMHGPVKADAAGKFRVETLAVEKHKLSVSGLGNGYYLKEIRYKGFPVAGDIIPLDSSAVTQSLTVVLDDKRAVITGVVVKGDKPVNRPRLILMRWPPPSGEAFPPTAVGTGDDQGKFQFGGLAPGEYRVVAYSSQNLADVTREVKQRALAAA